jgi:outer membrane lipopolysaccharide assembly protein LptE/RlpB
MKTLSLLLALSMALFATGCGNMFKGKQAAEQSVADFHRLYNEGKLAEIYSAGDSKFKGATTEKQFLEFVGAVQRKLGKVAQTSNEGFNIQTFNFTTTVVLNQSTTFEQGTGTETFTFQMEGGKAVLVGYNINSKDLILK